MTLLQSHPTDFASPHQRMLSELSLDAKHMSYVDERYIEVNNLNYKSFQAFNNKSAPIDERQPPRAHSIPRH
jgi:hypothetical protein